MSVTFPLKGDLKHMNAQYQHTVIVINRCRESPESMSWFSYKNCSWSLEAVKLNPWLWIICSNVIWSNVHDTNVNTERYLCISDYFHRLWTFAHRQKTGRFHLKFVQNEYLRFIQIFCRISLHKPVILIIYCNTLSSKILMEVKDVCLS